MSYHSFLSRSNNECESRISRQFAFHNELDKCDLLCANCHEEQHEYSRMVKLEIIKPCEGSVPDATSGMATNAID